jgi:hypothetical protein
MYARIRRASKIVVAICFKTVMSCQRIIIKKVVRKISKLKCIYVNLIFSGLLLLILILGTHVFADQPPYPNVVFHASTAEEEAKYVWYLIKNIEFFNQNGYRISLPTNSLIDDLKTKALQHQLHQDDYQKLKEAFEKEIYNPDKYKLGLIKLEETKDKVVKCFPTFLDYQDKWDFKMFPQYKVRLTLYGPGGSYNHKQGEIIMLTTETGWFKQEEPAQIIVHEMIHIGIEEIIIKKYNLAHWVKERIVDKFVDYHFRNQFPSYWMQNKGDTTIDPYLHHPDSWKRLPYYIDEYVKPIK